MHPLEKRAYAVTKEEVSHEKLDTFWEDFWDKTSLDQMLIFTPIRYTTKKAFERAERLNRGDNVLEGRFIIDCGVITEEALRVLQNYISDIHRMEGKY